MQFVNQQEFLEWARTGEWQSGLADTGWTRLSAVPLRSAVDFRDWLQAAGVSHQPYLHGSSPRLPILPGVYTSTEAPPRWPVPLHCEMSYTTTPPRYVFFFCLQATRDGGSTPIADMEVVTRAIGPEVRDTFAKRGLLNLRVLPKVRRWPYLTSWPRVYGTTDRDRVFEICHETEHQARFTPWGDLVLTNRQEAMREVGGNTLWFNQVTVFHRSFHQELQHWGMTGRAKAHRFYRGLAEFGAPMVAYPFDARYGDGTRIPDEVIFKVRQAHWDALQADPWQTGDLLILDNFRIAHGRAPFGGRRRVLVAMGHASVAPVNTD